MNERAKLLHSLTIERAADARVSPPRRRLWPVSRRRAWRCCRLLGLVWYFAPELASLRPVEQAATVAPASSPAVFRPRPPRRKRRAPAGLSLPATWWRGARPRSRRRSPARSSRCWSTRAMWCRRARPSRPARQHADRKRSQPRQVAGGRERGRRQRDRRRPARRRAHPRAHPGAVSKEFRHRGRPDQGRRPGRCAAGAAGARRRRRSRPPASTPSVRARCSAQHHIRAPFAGVVVERSAQPGEMISPISAGGGYTRTGICTIVDMDSIEVEVDVNEAFIGRVRAGGPVTAVLDAYPEWTIPGLGHRHRSDRQSREGDRQGAHRLQAERPAHPARHGHQGDVPGRDRRRHVLGRNLLRALSGDILHWRSHVRHPARPIDQSAQGLQQRQ